MDFKYVFGATPTVESASLRKSIFFLISGGRPNPGRPLNFEAAYRHVLFFNCEFLRFFSRTFFFLLKSWTELFF
jgi:hypothetical protein